MKKVKEYLERTAEVITQLIEDPDTYRIEDISELTRLNCELAEVLLKIEGAKSGTIQTSKTSTRTNKESK